MLEARGITVRFGGVTALVTVNLTAERGKVTGLIGPNGAGKSTLFNALTGMVRPVEGSVWLDDREITSWSPTRRARAGLGRTFQRLELFSHLSVYENVEVAVEFHRGWSGAGPAPRVVLMPSSNDSASATCRPIGSTSCPPVGAVWSRWPERWRSVRRCCCSTSRPPG